MSQSIEEIRKLLQAADRNGLPAFINTYEKDERAGVISLVQKAKKKIEAYEKELERTEKMKQYEKKYDSFSYICGIDISLTSNI